MTESLKGSFGRKPPTVLLEDIGASIIHEMAKSYGSPSTNLVQDAYFEELMVDFVERKSGDSLLRFLDQCMIKATPNIGCGLFRRSYAVDRDVFDAMCAGGREKLSNFCVRHNVPKTAGVSMHWYTGPRVGAGPV